VYEVAIVGERSAELADSLRRAYVPDVIYAGGNKEGDLPLLEGKLQPGQTTIYVCESGLCRRPVTTAAEALGLLHSLRSEAAMHAIAQ
jgi:uncharacterized protein YyaL (SSP411 family)